MINTLQLAWKWLVTKFLYSIVCYVGPCHNATPLYTTTSMGKYNIWEETFAINLNVTIAAIHIEPYNWGNRIPFHQWQFGTI